MLRSKLLTLTAAVFVSVLFGSFDSQGALPFGKNKGPANFADIVQPLLPAAVNITVTIEHKDDPNMLPPQMPQGQRALEDMFRQFFHGNPGRPRKSISGGSGFVVSQEGKDVFIVTCEHVIASATEIKVLLHDGTETLAEVVGADKRTDLALIKIKTDKKMSTVQWGDSSKVRVGEWLIAIGNPLGLGSTVTTGIVSTIARDISGRGSDKADFIEGYIQTDAPINMGNSGGAMFSLDGKVVAVSRAILTISGGSVGLGFGIPSNAAKSVIAQLKKYGRTKRGWLGVRFQLVTPEIAESLGLKDPHGALVGQVTPKGPSEKAGIQVQDIILNFNGQKIDKPRSFPHIVGKTAVGATVPIEVWRNGKRIKLKITVGEFEEAEKAGLLGNMPNPEEKAQKDSTETVLGITARELTPALKERYKIPTDLKGIFITFVAPGSEAFSKVLRPGDIIQQLTSGTLKKTPATLKDLKDFVTEAKKKKMKKILFLINTRGNLRYVALSLEEPKKDEKEKAGPKK